MKLFTALSLSIHLIQACEELVKASPTMTCVELVIEIQTDRYPLETSWKVENPSGDTVASASAGECSEMETLCTYNYCVPPECGYIFTISDSFGDGICCLDGFGSYAVIYDGVEVAQGGDFASSEEKSFGCAPTISPSIVPTETCEELVIEIRTDYYYYHTSWEVRDPSGDLLATGIGWECGGSNALCTYIYCLPQECGYTFTIFDSGGNGLCCQSGPGYYTVTYAGVKVAQGAEFGTSETTNFGCPFFPTVTPAPTIACEELVIEIFTDLWPSQTTWELEDPSGTTIATGNMQVSCGPETLCTYSYCLSQGCGYKFTIFDSGGNGLCGIDCNYGVGYYILTYAGVEVATNMNFGFSESTNVGCPPGVTHEPTAVPTTLSPTSLAPTVSSAPTITCEILKLRIRTDDYPEETSWEVTDPSGAIVVTGNPSECGMYGLCNYYYCLPQECGYTFTMFDTFGDGLGTNWYTQGWYRLTYAGVEVEHSVGDGFTESTTFGCPLESVNCIDSPLNATAGGGNMGCDFVASNLQYCAYGGNSHCPVSCSTCDTYRCADSGVEFTYDGGNYDCPFLNSGSQQIKDQACAIDDVAKTCRSTCGYCDE